MVFARSYYFVQSEDEHVTRLIAGLFKSLKSYGDNESLEKEDISVQLRASL